MAAYSGIETGLQSGLQHGADLREAGMRTQASPVGTQFSAQPKQPIYMVAPAPLSGSGMRRIISREQGRALETISHAVDYLQDCALHVGPDSGLINHASPATEATQILISLRQQMLQSFPLAESFSQRLWKAIFRRKVRQKSQVNSASVVRLSSR